MFSDQEFSMSAFKKAKWFDAYQYVKENEQLFFDNHQLLIDEILKLLFDDTLTKEVRSNFIFLFRTRLITIIRPKN